ncbi:MAG: Chemotaxis protein methyltransferase [Syntrophorhabdaceae bacterium PtaU1.Bin034]|nr:MAG: Chemotaxis protein methyltransferase [Syntrophorhabdaceae bacterium PtaU1.Bin034]
MLTNQEFVLLKDFIYEKTGIYFADNKAYLLEGRLTNRLNELSLSSFEDYYYYLKFGGSRTEQELKYLFDQVTTNETSFFRNPPQLDAFRIIVQKNYLNGTGFTGGLKIWSAGCSTGEEPFTLAIIMLELMAQMNRQIPFTIYGTDISPKVLESAKKAVFNNYSVRSTDKALLNKYFIENNNTFALRDSVKKYVSFDFLNLMDSASYRKYRQIDVIFCRNVLIYFDEKGKKKVVDNLYESLKPGGFLTIGHAESLHNISRGFKPLIFPGTIAYQKG